MHGFAYEEELGDGGSVNMMDTGQKPDKGQKSGKESKTDKELKDSKMYGFADTVGSGIVEGLEINFSKLQEYLAE